MAYSGAMRLLLQVSRCASQIVFSGFPTCEALLRNLMFSCMHRLDESESSILKALTSLRKSCSQFLAQKTLVRYILTF